MRISSCITPGESISLDIEGIGLDFDIGSFREFVSRMNALLKNVEDFQSILERESRCSECSAKRRPDGVFEVELPEGCVLEMKIVRPEVSE